MGNNPLNSDPHARIFITLNKPIHYAGEMVKGSVHLVIKEDRPQYRYICLIIDGLEETEWNQQDSMFPHMGKRIPYRGESTLVELREGLRVGHYSYQFAFLLPANMPASYFDNSTQSIQYHLSGCLMAGQEKKDVQTFKMKLHVREPPRGVIAPMIVEKETESECWSCCGSGGRLVLTFQLDGNHIRVIIGPIQVNAPFKVRGKIDLKASKTEISGFRIRLIERDTIIAGEQ